MFEKEELSMTLRAINDALNVPAGISAAALSSFWSLVGDTYRRIERSSVIKSGVYLEI